MGFIIARVETKDIATGEDMVPPYYKVYYEDKIDGSVTYEREFDTESEAKEYTNGGEWRKL